MVFLANFYVIDMCEDANSKAAPLLLGRPFMKAARTKIDDHNGTLTMEFDGESISFNIFEAMRYPSDIHSCFTIDVVDTLVQEICELGKNDALELLLTKNLEAGDFKEYKGGIHMIENIEELIAEFETFPPIEPRYDIFYIDLVLSNNKNFPSIMQAPTLELKTLPNHIKYIYLGEEETLPVIVARNLSSIQEVNKGTKRSQDGNWMDRYRHKGD